MAVFLLCDSERDREQLHTDPATVVVIRMVPVETGIHQGNTIQLDCVSFVPASAFQHQSSIVVTGTSTTALRISITKTTCQPLLLEYIKRHCHTLLLGAAAFLLLPQCCWCKCCVRPFVSAEHIAAVDAAAVQSLVFSGVLIELTSQLLPQSY